MEQIARVTDGDHEVLELRPCIGKGSLGRPLARWTDEMKQLLELLRAAGNKRPRTVGFKTPYERHMPSCGHKSIELMMLMMK
ncbi:jg19896 [Pararge aegeria aegeria]|uniref:Jg19896 protein n=1 Tax=Pararge aegeria aegeria TaxID=348720 RepID=A0A8S4SIF0_9NEOP|nr:jg19896 [Pararge aegeria aegeria]